MPTKRNHSKLIWLLLLTGVTAVLVTLMVLTEKEPPAVPEPTPTLIPPTPTPATQNEAIRDAVEVALRYIVTFQGGDDLASDAHPQTQCDGSTSSDNRCAAGSSGWCFQQQ